jgi:hypothetical protein
MAKKKLKAATKRQTKSASKKRAKKKVAKKKTARKIAKAARKKAARKKVAKKKVTAKKSSRKRAAKRSRTGATARANRAVANTVAAGAIGVIDQITALAAQSAIAQYKWLDNSGNRGKAPMAYFKGMAAVYARVYCKLKAGDPAALDMARKKTDDVGHDALALYNPVFTQLGMSNDSDGVDTLRHLFVLLTGLGVRESSGYHCRGRFMGQDFSHADDAEAGLFQTAYSLRNFYPSILIPLIQRYTNNPSGFVEIFSSGITCSAIDWRNWGDPSEPGYKLQQLTKTCPAFAAEYAAVGMRHSLRSWGPLRSTEVLKKPEVVPACDTLYKGVEAIMESAPGLCSQVM